MMISHLFAVLECGLPAEIPNAKLIFVNGTRGFKSLINYQCNPGYVASGRTVLMCDVDERWNGPPPRCDPVYCPEPASLRNGGFSLSTNSTKVGTVATYYCTSPRFVLTGVPKLNCLKDGTWDGETPKCRLRDEPAGPGRFPNIDRETLLRRPILKEKLPGIFKESGETNVRRKPISFAPGTFDNDNSGSPGADPRFPIRNEIPDSANVQANQVPRADVPVSAVQNERESRTQQLNLGESRAQVHHQMTLITCF